MKKGTRKISAVLLAVVLVAACAAGGTLAWMAAHTDPVVNTFAPGEVTSEVVEELDGNTKKDVQIQNTGNVDAYIRATVVINLVDNDGNVSAKTPVKDTDYTVSGFPGDNWFQEGGYYYYTEKVAAQDTTGNLIASIGPTENLPEGLHLQVTILAEAIQADGTNGSTPAVTDAWGVTVRNGQLSPS